MYHAIVIFETSERSQMHEFENRTWQDAIFPIIRPQYRSVVRERLNL